MACSSGSARRPSGISPFTVSRICARSSAGTGAHISGVSVAPGASALIRMPRSAYSTARLRTSDATPPFEAQ